MTAIAGCHDSLAAIVGSEHLILDYEERLNLSRDFSMLPFEVADAVVRPGTVAEVAAAVATVNAAGLALAVRGGGMSYTRGHTPTRQGVVLLDMRRLNRVLDIHGDDLHVEVEAGCTWEALYLALREHGVRTPFWGTLSGRHATIGGALSQNAVYFGSAAHGSALESVLGLTVVLADGTVVRTGSAGFTGAGGFARYYGPDLSGLFLGDSGALGVKVAATLRLIPLPEEVAAASFTYANRLQALAAMGEMARHRIASEIVSFDDVYHRLLDTMGFGFLRNASFSVHVVVEGVDRRHVRAGLDLLRRIGRRTGQEVDASVPLAIRADPFGSTEAMFRFEPRAVHQPVNALVPFSRAAAVVGAYEQFLRDRAETLSEHGIGVWTLSVAEGSDLNFEPALVVPADYRDPSVNPGGRNAVVELRRELAGRLDATGALHHQPARYYAFAERLEPGALDLLRRLKLAVDPDDTVSPGMLGL